MLRFIPPVTWLAFITYLFLLPGSELPTESWFEKIYLDKWVHTGFFFILIYLFYIPLKHKTWGTVTILALSALAYGIIIEVLQGFCIEGRSFDVFDILFDGLGCIAACFIVKRLTKK